MAKAIEFDSESLIKSLSEGKEISEEDLATVVGLLELVQKKRPNKELEEKLKIYRTPGLDEIYSLITILGKTNAKSHAEVIDSFLNYQEPLTVSLALEILCLKWELTESYLERVVGFALGVPWDVDGDLKHLSLTIVGEHVKKLGGPEAAPKELLELLLSSFSSKEADEWTKLKAYQSMLLASGIEVENIPSDFVSLDYSEGSEDINWGVIDKVKQVI